MTDATTLVENSWAQVAGLETQFTDTFYARLFTIRPDYKTTLFARTNMKAQAKMLFGMIDVAVKNLRNPTVLIPALQDAGMRHCRYGVRPADYGPVAEALLWTFEKFLGPKFTPEVKAAWIGVYTTIQTVMTGPCETEEGKRLLEEYDAKYGAPDATTLVENSWAQVAGLETQFTDTFYARLFTIRPDYKTTLFARTNMKAQAKMLFGMIDVAVKNLRNPTVLIPALQDAGMRHCRYGVRPADYGPVAEALLWTFEKFLGPKFTPEVKAAWIGVYTTIQTVMTGPCETEEGKRLLAEYDAKYGAPQGTAGCGCNYQWVQIGVLVAVVGVAAAFILRSRKCRRLCEKGLVQRRHPLIGYISKEACCAVCNAAMRPFASRAAGACTFSTTGR
jgi:hemoglobin-like flavoprotein